MERHSFRIVSCESPETMRKLCLSTNFSHQKLGEVTVFFAVSIYMLSRSAMTSINLVLRSSDLNIIILDISYFHVRTFSNFCQTERRCYETMPFTSENFSFAINHLRVNVLLFCSYVCYYFVLMFVIILCYYFVLMFGPFYLFHLLLLVVSYE